MEQKPITVFAKWQVKNGELDKVLTLFAEVAQKSAAEEGNLFYKIHQSNTDANTLLLYEGYKDETALDAHRESAHFQEIVVTQIVPLLTSREVNITTQLALS